MSLASSLLGAVERAESESAELEFKASFDPAEASQWCEVIKDIVAIANSGGGAIVFGVNDDGTPCAADLSAVLGIDPATITDKIKKYTGQHFAGCSMARGTYQAHPVAILSITSPSMPMVFTAPGTYDSGAGKQKTAFSVGTVYFRHGAKSDPGTSEDLRLALERELSRIRSSWLDGIAKVVTAPPGTMVSVLPAEVSLSGAEGATGVRLVNDEAAPAFKAMRNRPSLPAPAKGSGRPGQQAAGRERDFGPRRPQRSKGTLNRVATQLLLQAAVLVSPVQSGVRRVDGGAVPRRLRFLRQGSRGLEEGLRMKSEGDLLEDRRAKR